LHDWAAEQQKPVRFIALHRVQKLRPANLPPEQTTNAAGRRLASRRVCCARFVSPSAMCTQQMMTQGLDRPAAPSRPAAAPVPCARLYTVCRGTFSAAEAALGLQPAAPAVSLDDSICQMQGGDGGIIARLGSRAAETVRFIALHRVQKLRPANLPPEQTTNAAVGASQAVVYAVRNSYLRVHSKRIWWQLCTQQAPH